MKNAMFQYATGNKILVDTDLITLDEAKSLFDEKKSDYIERLGKDEEPEMAIWINCATNSSYSETLKHWCADDMKLIDGQLYVRV
ncbi:MAG: hypothetical protein ACI9N9_002362 [Enterobacterales bacterium]|jgi:DNA topoisomerase VI subunit A